MTDVELAVPLSSSLRADTGTICRAYSEFGTNVRRRRCFFFEGWFLTLNFPKKLISKSLFDFEPNFELAKKFFEGPSHPLWGVSVTDTNLLMAHNLMDDNRICRMTNWTR